LRLIVFVVSTHVRAKLFPQDWAADAPSRHLSEIGRPANASGTRSSMAFDRLLMAIIPDLTERKSRFTAGSDRPARRYC
jgi:hypothetical protein